MAKRTLILILLLVSLIAAAYIYFRVLDRDERIKIRENYPFMQEGELFFINPALADTLVRIDIEIAGDQEEISRGLMYRDHLPADAGMLFIFPSAEQRTFWMKNTRIPLDILFIGENHEVLYIIQHTTPFSTNPLPGFHESSYVVEVNAGFCMKNGIKEGQFIQFRRL